MPLLLQAARAEMDCYPAPALANLSRRGLRRFFHDEFAAAFGSDLARSLAWFNSELGGILLNCRT